MGLSSPPTLVPMCRLLTRPGPVDSVQNIFHMRSRRTCVAICAYGGRASIVENATSVAGTIPFRRVPRRHCPCSAHSMTTGSRESFADPQTYAIIGAAMEVHRELGCGYLETVYRAALAMEFESRALEFADEVPIPIRYKQRPLPLGYRADFVCYGTVLVEVKALDGLGPLEQAQVMNYLKGTNLHRAVLLNFGTPTLQYRRIVRQLSPERDPLRRVAEP